MPLSHMSPAGASREREIGTGAAGGWLGSRSLPRDPAWGSLSRSNGPADRWAFVVTDDVNNVWRCGCAFSGWLAHYVLLLLVLAAAGQPHYLACRSPAGL
jgi:hypothetical protein